MRISQPIVDPATPSCVSEAENRFDSLAFAWVSDPLASNQARLSPSHVDSVESTLALSVTPFGVRVDVALLNVSCYAQAQPQSEHESATPALRIVAAALAHLLGIRPNPVNRHHGGQTQESEK